MNVRKSVVSRADIGKLSDEPMHEMGKSGNCTRVLVGRTDRGIHLLPCKILCGQFFEW